MNLVNAFLSALILAQLACTPTQSAPPKQSPADQGKTEQNGPGPTVVSVTAIKSPYVPVPDYQFINGNYSFTELPIGYGIDFSFGDELPKYTTKNCVDLKLETYPGNWSEGSFASVTTPYDIERNADPFTEFKRYRKGAELLNPEIQSFVKSANRNLESGSVATSFGGVIGVGTIYGRPTNEMRPVRGCKSGHAGANRYLTSIDFGVRYFVVAKVNFISKEAVTRWEKTHNESVVHSVFGKSDLSPFLVSQRLVSAGASIDILVLQSGGDTTATETALRGSNCTVENIEACRKIRPQIWDVVTHQVPSTLTLENWYKYGVIGFDTRGFDLH